MIVIALVVLTIAQGIVNAFFLVEILDLGGRLDEIEKDGL